MLISRLIPMPWWFGGTNKKENQMRLGVEKKWTLNCPANVVITDYGQPYAYKALQHILCTVDQIDEENGDTFFLSGKWYEVTEIESSLYVEDDRGNFCCIFNPFSNSKIFEFDCHFNLLSYKPNSPVMEERISFLVRLYEHEKTISDSLIIRDEAVFSV